MVLCLKALCGAAQPASSGWLWVQTQLTSAVVTAQLTWGPCVTTWRGRCTGLGLPLVLRVADVGAE